jgi:hypothetical protein
MCAMSAAKEIYFDTHAFGDLFRSDAELRGQALRRDVRAAIRGGQFSLVTSGWVLEELGSLAVERWDAYKKLMRFVVDNVKVVFDDTADLVLHEVRLGRRLKGPERRAGGGSLTNAQDAIGRPQSSAIASYELHRKRSRGRLQDQQIQRQETLARLLASGYDTRDAIGEWTKRSPELIDMWAREVLDGIMTADGRPPLPPDLPIRTAPSAVNYVAISLARIAWYFGEGRRIEEGDDADAHEYTGACYADVFVSPNDRLRQICALLPQAQAHPLPMDEFARRYLGWK